MTEKKSIWHQLGNLDYRIIYLIVALLTALPLWIPMGTPMSVGDNVKNYADTLRSFSGEVVLCSFSGYMTMLPDVEPIYLATWKMLFEQDCKILVLLTHPDSPAVILEEFEKIDPLGQFGKVYGEDYMIFPYLDMTEAATIAFTDKIMAIFERDFYGNSLDDADKLPMMQNIQSANQVDWYISSSPEFSTRRYSVPFGVKLLCWGTGTGLLPFVPPFYDPENGPVYGYVGGASQGGELEKYSGHFGKGVKYNDAKNLALVGLFIFVLAGNIAFFAEKLGGGD
ncbi:MAG: hypothetical protein ACETVY_05075 [Candidatus Bathyarchaeia archaeon]